MRDKTVNYDKPDSNNEYAAENHYFKEITEQESRAYKTLSITATIIVGLIIIARLIWTIMFLTTGPDKAVAISLIMESVIYCLMAFGVLILIVALCEYFEDVHIIRLQGFKRK